MNNRHLFITVLESKSVIKALADSVSGGVHFLDYRWLPSRPNLTWRKEVGELSRVFFISALIPFMRGSSLTTQTLPSSGV